MGNPERWFEVTKFGADPTGGTDTTAALQACLDAAAGAGRVRIPPGEYSVSVLKIPPNSDILMDPAARVYRGRHVRVTDWRAERPRIIYDLECGHQLREEVAAGYLTAPRQFVEECQVCRYSTR